MMIPKELLRARRLVLGAMLADGHVPTPGMFVRAGLPAVFRASEWLAAEAANKAEVNTDSVGPDERTTPDGLAWAAEQRRRSEALRRRGS